MTVACGNMQNLPIVGGDWIILLSLTDTFEFLCMLTERPGSLRCIVLSWKLLLGLVRKEWRLVIFQINRGLTIV